MISKRITNSFLAISMMLSVSLAFTGGLIDESIAADNPPKVSPVKARARDFYAPNSEDLGPNERA